MKIDYTIRLKNFIFIALGVAIYAFGFVNFNMANHIAEGGMAGLTLVFHALFGINPTYTGYLFNLPLLLFGIYFFGRKMMVYTIYGTTLMYFFVLYLSKIPSFILIYSMII
ncbi:YitT family protein [Streptococcus troglodytae]|uniref:YitT family protein n=1 Tax=Streptococcus troglodytae TaxID=1111760 RepID=A0A1L7LM87_9STRE|nr:YitT family protein [Streptococcus troglodytae]